MNLSIWEINKKNPMFEIFQKIYYQASWALDFHYSWSEATTLSGTFEAFHSIPQEKTQKGRKHSSSTSGWLLLLGKNGGL